MTLRRLLQLLACMLVVLIAIPFTAGCLLMQSQSQRIDKQIRNLASEDSAVRERAVEELVRIGPPAVGKLTVALKNADIEVRASAAEALGKIGSTKLIPGETVYDPVASLLTALGDANASVRHQARNALANMGVPAFLRLIDSSDRLLSQLDVPESELSAARRATLSGMKGKDDAESLALTLGDPLTYYDVPEEAFVVLGNIGTPALIFSAQHSAIEGGYLERGARLCAVIVANFPKSSDAATAVSEMREYLRAKVKELQKRAGYFRRLVNAVKRNTTMGAPEEGLSADSYGRIDYGRIALPLRKFAQTKRLAEALTHMGNAVFYGDSAISGEPTEGAYISPEGSTYYIDVEESLRALAQCDRNLREARTLLK